WLRVFRLDRDVWRHLGPGELAAVAASTALGSLTFAVVERGVLRGDDYPLSVVVLDALACAALLTGLRALRRLHHGLRRRGAPTPGRRRRVPSTRRAIIVGDEDAAARLLLEIAGREPRTHHAIGLVVPHTHPAGLRVHDVPILGDLDQLESIVAERVPDAVLVAASALEQPGLR